MKKLIGALIICLAATLAHAEGPDFIWAGGGLKISNNSNPCTYADSFILLGQFDTMSLFTQPMITMRGGDLGLDLGLGGRMPVESGYMLAGWNVFVDYTSDNSHKRLGTGAELYHPNFSAHMNLYLPVSDEKDYTEALPGLDLTFGIPLPNAPFVSVWPGAYYYSGKDRQDKGGISMMVQVQPIKPLTLSLGGRNDALQAGRDSSELYFKVEFTVPFDRLGKDLFAFTLGEYPLDVKTQMDHRVMREEFITFEHKRR